ncbi:hypothetical protein ACET3Z_030465 [Daucus carota]
MNDHEASTSGTKNEIELTQFPHTYFENDSDSDEDFDRYSYVYEIDENAEGQYISSSPSNISVRTPPVDVPPAQIIPPHNPYSFRHSFFVNSLGVSIEDDREKTNNLIKPPENLRVILTIKLIVVAECRAC